MTREFYIFGTNETSRVMFQSLKQDLPEYFHENFSGMTVDREFAKEIPEWLEPNQSIVPFGDLLKSRYFCNLYLPIYNNLLREKVFNEARRFNIHPASHIDSRANVDKDVLVGDGSWIQMGTSIQTGAKVGDGVIIWGNTWIGHSAKIGDFSFISSNSTLCGNVTIGKHCYVGVGVHIKENVTIQDGTTLGMGAIITKDVPCGTYLAGVNNRRA